MSSSELRLRAGADPGVRPFLPGTVAGVEATADRRSDGFVTGYATGYAEGMRRAAAAVTGREQARAAVARQEQELTRARVTDLLLALRGGAAQLQEDAAEQVDDLAAVVARCSAHLARHVVLEAAPTADALLARLRRGLQEAPRDTRTTVSVSRDGLRTLERAGLLPDGLPDGVVVTVQDDLGPGDVVVRAGAATITDLLTAAVATTITAMTEDVA